MTKYSTLKRGFTLVEILIVISIISLLIPLGLFSYSAVGRKARDVQRIADLNKIRNYLEIYHNRFGQYPEEVKSGGDCWGDWESGSTLNGQNDQFLQVLVDQGITTGVPIERHPIINDADFFGPTSKCSYRYIRLTDPCGGTNKIFAVLYAWLETESGEKDTRPESNFGCWSGGMPGSLIDKKDWIIVLEE